MKQIAYLDEADLSEMEVFLEEIFAGIEEESYQIVGHPEGGGDGWVYLSDNAIGFLKTHNDHECTASPEDGCEFCYKLQLLGMLPDPDEDHPDSEREAERLENIRDSLMDK